VLLGAGLLSAATMIEAARRWPRTTVDTAVARAVIAEHVAFISLTTIAAVVLATVLVGAGSRVVRRLATPVGLALVGLVFLQTGWLLRSFNPTIDARFVYPVTPALAAIRERTGDALTLWLDGAALPANSNLWYRLPSLSNYDAMGVATYEDLHHQLVTQPHPALEWQAHPAGLRALQVLGVQYVATDQAWPGASVRSPLADARGYRTTPITADWPLVQRFSTTEAGLSAVAVRLTTFGRRPDCTLTLTLADAGSGVTIAQATSPCAAVRDDWPLIVSIPPRPDPGRRYALTLASSAPTPEAAVGAVYAPRGAGSDLRAGPPGQAILIGQLLFTTITGQLDGLRPVWTDGQVRLFAVPDALPEQFTVGRAHGAATPEDVVALLLRPDVDLRRSVVLTGAAPAAPASDEAGDASVIDATPTRRVLRAERGTPGWLVVLQTDYPGWQATVNGQPAPLVRANGAFVAVPVPAGVSEVTLTYDPLSVRLGLLLSGVAVVGIIGAAAHLLWQRRRRAPAIDPEP
jgi:hypothetical protein